jgi:hypothetical protein
MITGFNNNFKSDLSLGLAGEAFVLPKLQEKFSKSIRKTGTYDKYDYIDDAGTKYELKTRRNTMNAFPTTFLPAHKVIEGEQYFIFNYTDKIAYIKYEAELFKTFDIQILDDRRSGFSKKIPHYLIPVAKLTVL